jgi:hypothetical protein
MATNQTTSSKFNKTVIIQKTASSNSNNYYNYISAQYQKITENFRINFHKKPVKIFPEKESFLI